MKYLQQTIFLLLVTFLGMNSATAQSSATRAASDINTVFYKVTGKDLKEPSYLFGTFHLLNSSYIDSLSHVMQKFNECKVFAGELLIDSTLATGMNSASLLNGTTLDKLLSAEAYQKTSEWLKELSGYELNMFNSLNPMTISAIITVFIQQALFPGDPANPKPGMDEYLQTLSRTQGKEVYGLETVEDQVYAIYTQFTNERQAEFLSMVVNAKEKTATNTRLMNKYYREQNINQLLPLMYDDTFTNTEIDVLLGNRNKSWMRQLPEMIRKSSTFIAVGALHLPGEQGLVRLLRKEGYKVEPLDSIETKKLN